MTVVVDTNVAVVANGKSQQACATCVLTCTEKLQQIMSGEMKLVLDYGWRVLDEYMRNLNSSGADVGDRFLRWLLTHKDKQCDFVSITPIDGEENNFQEFPTDNISNFRSSRSQIYRRCTRTLRKTSHLTSGR